MREGSFYGSCFLNFLVAYILGAVAITTKSSIFIILSFLGGAIIMMLISAHFVKDEISPL
ncbi:hypothetical protein ES703_36794 [subsurface metagenome]